MLRPPQLTRDGLLAAARGLLVAVVVVGASGWLLADLLKSHHLWLYDFRGGLYNAGQAILHGHDPYRAGFIARQAAIMRAGGIAIGETAAHAFSLPVYPAPANLAVLPLSLLPYWPAAALFTIASVVAMVLALRLLEVRDWRCYGLTLISWPFVYGVELGALGPLIVLGAAAVWRWRERLWPPAIALASIVMAKVFPFPLAAWLLITRGYRQFLLALALGAAATLLAWAVLGFSGMTEYPTMLSNLSFIQEGRSDSLVAGLLATGLSAPLAQGVAILCAGALLLLARRLGRTPRGQPQAFGLAVMAALTASPIVWDHYLVLLFVPIALLSPGYSQLWLIPLGGPVLLALSAIAFPSGSLLAAHDPHNTRMAIITLCLEGLVVARLCRGAGSRTEVPVLTGHGSAHAAAPWAAA
jgi:hypothetical protein